jgi:hypothetical protein
MALHVRGVTVAMEKYSYRVANLLKQIFGLGSTKFGEKEALPWDR